jgi:hypothetical protein
MVLPRRDPFFEYLEVSDPTDTYDPTYMVQDPPVLQDGSRVIAYMEPKTSMDGYYSRLYPPPPDLPSSFPRNNYAHVTIFIAGCGVAGLGTNVYFESSLNKESASGGGRPFYFDQNLVPRLDYTETSGPGSGGFIKVVPDSTGLATFTARRRDTNQIVAKATSPVKIGYVTNIFLTPSPAAGW